MLRGARSAPQRLAQHKTTTPSQQHDSIAVSCTSFGSPCSTFGLYVRTDCTMPCMLSPINETSQFAFIDCTEHVSGGLASGFLLHEHSQCERHSPHIRRGWSKQCLKHMSQRMRQRGHGARPQSNGIVSRRQRGIGDTTGVDACAIVDIPVSSVYENIDARLYKRSDDKFADRVLCGSQNNNNARALASVCRLWLCIRLDWSTGL